MKAVFPIPDIIRAFDGGSSDLRITLNDGFLQTRDLAPRKRTFQEMKIQFKEVYHSSRTQGLKKVVPQESTHRVSWVYATCDMVMAAAFLGTLGGDLTCAVGRDTEIEWTPFICERFDGAFDLRYGNVRGSIYVLPGKDFIAGKTQWDEEVVCSEAVTPIREIRISSAKEYLLQLAKEGALTVYFYPERPSCIPEDDEDLVHRAAVWHKRFGNRILDNVNKYHPHLLEWILRAIKEGKY